MTQKPVNHKGCRTKAHKLVQRAKYALYELSCIDCEESGVQEHKAEIAHITDDLEQLRRKFSPILARRNTENGQ
jgi:hypothetical protein